MCTFRNRLASAAPEHRLGALKRTCTFRNRLASAAPEHRLCALKRTCTFRNRLASAAPEHRLCALKRTCTFRNRLASAAPEHRLGALKRTCTFWNRLASAAPAAAGCLFEDGLCRPAETCVNETRSSVAQSAEGPGDGEGVSSRAQAQVASPTSGLTDWPRGHQPPRHVSPSAQWLGLGARAADGSVRRLAGSSLPQTEGLPLFRGLASGSCSVVCPGVGTHPASLTGPGEELCVAPSTVRSAADAVTRGRRTGSRLSFGHRDRHGNQKRMCAQGCAV
ncbi:hypothetical protein E5288_WYG010403 [Bos mutus]|uniref:Uncharacterized protein n=1 Tax=Bos mutus TaxID=72004 RepID=A0A6B0RZI3_9CETA|nr:hypothetical protein [Bos mutus]